MKPRFLLTTLLAVTVVLTGCDKAKSLFGSKDESAEIAQEAPAPLETASAGPAAAESKSTSAPAASSAPGSTSTPAAPEINKNAAVVVFCYHSIDEKPAGQYAITPAEFESNLQEIVDNGFTIIGMQDFLAWRREEKAIPDKSAIITIDDGYNSGYHTAWPILKKHGYPFTMFVYTKFISAGGKSITWEQLAEMRDGGVDIQNHTYSHQNLKGKGKKEAEGIKALGGFDKWLRRELGESKEILESKLGISVNAVAYPFGVIGPDARAMLQELGYEAGFTVYGQRVGFGSPSDMIGRYAIDRTQPQNFANGVRMIGGGGGSVAPVSNIAQVAASSLITQPKHGETISNPKPLISADLTHFGVIDADSLTVRISGIGAVPAKYDPATKVVSYQPTTQSLRNKEYTVIISAKSGGKSKEARWTFHFNPTATTSASADDSVNSPEAQR